ncbi:MAG: D-alanyl-D-alanine carboxypeptidase/D-alanyl-D-alanine-endopeptidase [Oligoflexales bacterium]|nr:D-alanyl-D-alanine carboxypeptidase/D-alanyl-D-alanine-endopeptidase [Oligoflexales bacterium]
MHQWLIIWQLLTSAMFFIPIPSSGQTVAVASGSQKSRVDRLFRVRNSRLKQGIYIARVQDGKVIYKSQESELFSPASVTKLVTSAALLHYFGPTFRFKTKIGHSGSFTNGILKGNLIIEGDGDPSFVSETLWGVVADLKHMGLKEVSGNILINNSIFSGSIRDEIRNEGKNASNHAYDAPVTAFGVNFNTLAIAIFPGSRVGEKTRVELDPYPIGGVLIDNRIKTSRSNSRASYRVSRVSLAGGKSKIVLSGRIPLGYPLQKIYRSVNDPVLTSGEIFRRFLKEQGIVVKGTVTETTAHAEHTLLTVPSKPIETIIRDLNIHSNNFIADVMVKRLGAQDLSKNYSAINSQGSYENGMKAITKFLSKDVGINTAFVLENGSGLTSQNRLSAEQVSKLLIYMAKRWDLFPEFLASLPTSGKTGTLEKRFQSAATTSLQGHIRAKTGTLTDPYTVSSLAGYVNHPKHGILAFTIIQNGKLGQRQPGILDLQESQEIGLLGVTRYL